MRSGLKQELQELIDKLKRLGSTEKKKTGFFIGNTVKFDEQRFYFTPIRTTEKIVTAGAVVSDEASAIEIAQTVDGHVNYVLVDAEKKIPSNKSDELANVEGAVRGTIRESVVWAYKGNDITVAAVDYLIIQLTKNEARGIGGKKVVIIGAGNIGSKLALRLVERGARVFITRRNTDKLKLIAEALNSIKPLYTESEVISIADNEKAASGADILIGTAAGKPVITKKIIANISENAFIIDVGKGTLDNEAVKIAEERNISVYRLDVTAAIEGLLTALYISEYIAENVMGRRKIGGVSVVSGGLFAQKNELVVDNVWDPKYIYGIADGVGDFIRKMTNEQKKLIMKFKSDINI